MLAVAGGKGGVGKTTTAVGLGRALARAGRRPLLVDCDTAMPDLARVAGLPRPESGDGVTAVAEGRPVSEVARASPGTDIAVLPPGNADPATLGAALAHIDWPGPVVLDCPAGAGRGATLPLRAADRAVVVSTAARASLRDATKTAAMARALGSEVAGVVVTRRPKPPEGVDRLLGAPVLASVPETDEPAVEALNCYERAASSLFADQPCGQRINGSSH